MANISVTNSLNDNSATSDITLVGTNFTDLVNGLTDGTKDISISNGSFAGVVKSANGTVALPGISFTNDLDCGLYRIGANNIGAAVNGAKVLDISTSGLGLTGDLIADADGLAVKQVDSTTGYTHVLCGRYNAAATSNQDIVAINMNGGATHSVTAFLTLSSENSAQGATYQIGFLTTDSGSTITSDVSALDAGISNVSFTITTSGTSATIRLDNSHASSSRQGTISILISGTSALPKTKITWGL